MSRTVASLATVAALVFFLFLDTHRTTTRTITRTVSPRVVVRVVKHAGRRTIVLRSWPTTIPVGKSRVRVDSANPRPPCLPVGDDEATGDDGTTYCVVRSTEPKNVRHPWLLQQMF